MLMRHLESDVYNAGWSQRERAVELAKAVVAWTDEHYPGVSRDVYIPVEDMAGICKSCGVTPREWSYLRCRKWLDSLCSMHDQPGEPLCRLELVQKMSTKLFIWKWSPKTEEDGA